MTYALRAAGILASAVLILGIGLWLGPRPVEVQASVYQRFAADFTAAPLMADGLLGSGPPRPVGINGQKMTIRYFKTDHSVQDVLDFYDREWREAVDFRGDPALEELIMRFPEANLPVVRRHHEHMARDIIERGVEIKEVEQDGHFGYLMRIRILERPATIAEAVKTTMGKYLAFAESGRLSDLGPTLVVQAFKGEGESAPVEVLLFVPDPEFNFYQAFEPDDRGDMPGWDPKDIPRFPGSTRSYSVAQPGRVNDSTMTCYHAPTPPSAVRRHYEAELTRGGWSLDPAFNSALDSAGDRDSLAARHQDGREATVHWTAGENGLTEMVVLVRQAAG